MHRSPANISLIVNRFFPLPVFFHISAHIIFCCILHLSQFLNRCSLVCVLYRHHPHSAVSEFFVHFRYCLVRQCPVLSGWYLPASLFGPRATNLFWCIVFGIWYFLPLTLFFDHIHASSHFFPEISRFRLARDLGSGINRLPYLSL